MNSDLEIGRSLIQKAIRRADLEMTRKAALWLVHAGDFEWLRNRLAVLVFEECWTFGKVASYEWDEKIILNHLLKLAGTIKNRNASGLGSLGYAGSQSDVSVLSGDESDVHIKSIGKAIHAPEKFWKEVRGQAIGDDQNFLIERAFNSFEMAEQPWDKAFIMAAAYLAWLGEVPETKYAAPATNSDFPLWIAIDMHTHKGVHAITEGARQINFDAEKALWLTFYLEGAICNEVMLSPWWEKEKVWRMKKLGLTLEEGQSVYKRLKPVLIEILKEESEKLEERIRCPDNYRDR